MLLGNCATQITQGIGQLLYSIQAQTRTPVPTSYRCRIVQESGELMLLDGKGRCHSLLTGVVEHVLALNFDP